MRAICTGCGVSSETLKEYTIEDPVEDDHTYQDGKFVCDDCYGQLDDWGLGGGTPIDIQLAAAEHLYTQCDSPNTRIPNIRFVDGVKRGE